MKFKDYFKTPGKIGKTGLFTAVAGITTGWFIFPFALDYILGKRITLVEGTQGRKLWTNLPPLVTSIYLFNVTNPKEVQNGAKPIVEEIGPYCYLAYKEKLNLVDDEEDDTVSYTGKSTWYKLLPSADDFQKKGPVCHQTLTGNEVIVQPNAFLMAVLLKARQDFPPPLLNFVNSALPGIWGRLTDVFLTATASQLIFDGILINCTSSALLPRVVCIAVEQNSKALVKLAKNLYLFSFFGGQNGTLSDYRITVKRGSKDLLDVGRMTQIDGNTELPFWKGECNKIYGTDSTIFPPHRRRDNVSFTSYVPELCRVVKGTYVGEAEVNGIKGHEYLVSFGKGGADPVSRCYCARPNKCPPGALEVTNCLGAPLTATFPHFYDAPEFQNDVIGLNPDRSKHATYGILQETSGVPLRARRRIQISIELKKIPYVGVTSKLKGYMCPLLWIEEAFDLEGDLLSMVKYQLVLGLTAMSYFKWGLLLIGAGLSVFGGVGKYMNGPNWNKKTKNGNLDSAERDFPQLEKGNGYQQFSDDPAAKSIMFYTDKFKKTDTSMQTDPLFYAVKNVERLNLEESKLKESKTEKLKPNLKEKNFTFNFGDDIDPDSQSQPFQEDRIHPKLRLNSPENMIVDSRFPLLNAIDEDFKGYSVINPKGSLTNQKGVYASKVDSLNFGTQGSKLIEQMERINGRLDILENMKNNAPNTDMGIYTEIRNIDDLGKNKLEGERELKRQFLQIEAPKMQKELSNDALETRNLKLEEEARKLRVELNVLRGLKNGQFPLKKDKVDLVRAENNQTNSVKVVQSHTLTNRILTKASSKKPSIQPVAIQKPVVRSQTEVDSKSANGQGGTNAFEENDEEREKVINYGHQLNSREKFFGLQADKNIDGNIEGISSIIKPAGLNEVEAIREQKFKASIEERKTDSKAFLNPPIVQDNSEFSESRKFENEVFRVLRGEVENQSRDYDEYTKNEGETNLKQLEQNRFVKPSTFRGDRLNPLQDKGSIFEETAPIGEKSEQLRKKYYENLNSEGSTKRKKMQVSSSTEDSSDQIATAETTLDEDSNPEDLADKLREMSPQTEKEENDQLPDLKKVKIKKNWKKVLTIVHTSRQIYNYRQLEKRQLFGELVEDYRDDPNLENDGGGNSIGDAIEQAEQAGASRALTRANSFDSDSVDADDSLAKSLENTPSMQRRRPSLKYLERVASLDSLFDSEGMSDATVTVTGAFSGGIMRRRLSRDSLSDNDNS